MGGDFNLVMDFQKDKKGGNATTHRNSLKEVQNIANSLDLTDVWRTLNPDGNISISLGGELRGCEWG